MSTLGLEHWTVDELDLQPDDPRMDVIVPAIDILISRLEEARRRGASDPLVTITAKSAGGNSRECTKRMLMQLGLAPNSRRAVHRLLGGSPSGWSGLLRIFSEGRGLTEEEFVYARRQLLCINPGHAVAQSSMGA
ncbi:hypothetical protein LL946_04705 [Knoellia locipacati]|uniref:hypothetical protein n=1 Tax=Knoellia locipacati TaxID=882824 RepID=UPI00384D568E